MKISACIITHDEADRIGACCDSLQFCDEILVVDSHSADDTRAVAAAHGARVIERDWPGYRSQREFAMQAATHDWILAVDADERVSAPLREQLQALRAEIDAGADIAGAMVPTLTNYFGRFLRHGNAWPDRHPRFYDRRRSHWMAGYEIHERVSVEGPMRTLNGPLEHYSYRHFGEHLRKMDTYAELMARHMHAAGRRASLAQVLFNPPWRFVRGYVIKRGFLDGWRGLVYHLVEAGYVRRKYLRLWMQKKAPQAGL